MTQIETIVDWAKNQVGITENPKGSNNIVYNTLYYGKAVSGDAYPWCMVFVWCAFDLNGMKSLFYAGRKTASCTTLMRWAKSANQFHESGFKVGDIVFYNWDDDDMSEHTGIIVEANGDDKLRVVEGNCADMVRMTEPSRKTILGVFRPAYKDEPKPEPTPSAPTCSVKMRELRRGDKDKDGSIAVWSLQKNLVKRGYSVGRWGTDGDFGNDTEEAVKRFQADHHLAADGIAGAKTLAALYD